MGNDNSTHEIRSINYREGYETAEFDVNYLNKTKSLISYEYNESHVLGLANDFLSDNLKKEFQILKKNNNLIDIQRKRYNNRIDCCLQDKNFIDNVENGKSFYSKCDNKFLDSASLSCSNIFYNLCINDITGHKVCKTWLINIIKNKINPEFNQFIQYIKNEKNINTEITKTVLTTLRLHADENNDYNNLADNILTSYSDDIKKKYFKCAFPEKKIIYLENNIINYPKECWYKECAFSPKYKLLTKNILNQNKCSITICDIDINKLNDEFNNLKIICQNNYKKKYVNLDNFSFTQDSNKIFFIPTYFNTFFIFSILMLFLNY